MPGQPLIIAVKHPPDVVHINSLAQEKQELEEGVASIRQFLEELAQKDIPRTLYVETTPGI